MMKRILTVLLSAAALLAGAARLGAENQPPAPAASEAPEPKRLVTEDQEQRVLEFLETHFASMHRNLTAQRTTNPEKYHNAVHENYKRFRRLLYMPVDQQKAELRVAQLNLEIDRKTKDHKKITDDAGRKELEKQLKETLAQWFDAQMEVRQLRLRALEEQVSRWKAEIEQRLKQRDGIIARDLEKIIKANAPASKKPSPPKSAEKSAPSEPPASTAPAKDKPQK